MYLYINQKIEKQTMYYARKYGIGKYRKSGKNQNSTQNKMTKIKPWIHYENFYKLLQPLY